MTLPDLIRKRYVSGDSDYWMKPLVAHCDDEPLGRIRNGDSVVFMCRRGEREVQLTEAFTEKSFHAFSRELKASDIMFVPLVEYHERLSHIRPIIEPIRPTNTLAEILSRQGIRQMCITESEKESHVTFFYNGRRNTLFPKQNKKIIPSWDDFAQHPEMKSSQIADAVIEELDRPGFILVNFPAGDVIGHLESWDAKISAVEAVDEALGKIYSEATLKDWTILVTADHGLMEVGRTRDGKPSVVHTKSPVPFIVASNHVSQQDLLISNASLKNVAPAVLSLMGLPIPNEMEASLLLRARVKTDKVLLVILDGWGEGNNDALVNPIIAADTPTYDFLKADYPWVTLEASGESVGLPGGRKGNSETGHLTIGAGRVIEQDETRVQHLMDEGLEKIGFVNEILSKTTNSRGSFHVIGMLSEESSHGRIDETAKMTQIAAQKNLENIFVHLILDGRSAPVRSAADMLERHSHSLAGKIVTLVGRGYALDRGKDYLGKTKLVYEALVNGKGISFNTYMSSSSECSV